MPENDFTSQMAQVQYAITPLIKKGNMADQRHYRSVADKHFVQTAQVNI
jgi:hypothetical protein